MTKKNPEPTDVLYRVKRGLAAYVSYLAACEMNQAFSEYVLYEPILRILTARGYITKAVHMLGLSQEAAGRRMGLSQPKVSGLFRGTFANISERKLMDCLNRLGYDIEIKVKPAAAKSPSSN